MTVAQRMWLTPVARQRLEEELETLKKWTTETADGDDSNAVAVRRAQQGRIQEIHELLVNAVVGEDPPNDGVAEPGMVLTVHFGDPEDTETFLLGVRGADYGDIEVYSMSSPLGAAIDGARVGETRRYDLPNGATQEVTLVRAVPYGLHEH
ncbi:GreA/GreB family elongation factor [Mycobacterium sp. ACS4331]|uniref:GreA/GreB family elongation factor n=1 Tax=Mycobacterium sp. ACS4331 TaxID=1834121 RepID=UPI0007FC57CB|nr:GreA/GreB family elongation factor [Mycobacterium sp. ACS4331]OBF30447.1 transcription elongation factor GreAB [Mycobacterium sp. ACS4331]